MPAPLLPASPTATLASLAKAAEARKLPPIAQWNPAQTADSHIQIRADGSWLHEGRVIPRLEMVQVFATLLTRDGEGQHWLVTPECRQSVVVDDTAFVAVDMREDAGTLLFRLNTGDWVGAGPDLPLVVTEDGGQPRACLQLANGCEARLNRSTWLQLVETALIQGSSTVTSGGSIFALNPEA